MIGAPAPDLTITGEVGPALKRAAGGVMLHATGSRLDKVEGELAQALAAGLSVASTCEELAFPWLRNREIAERLDRLAEKKKVALLGTGVNPGFVMDRLPGLLGQAVGPVERLRCLRVVSQCFQQTMNTRLFGKN